MGVIYDVYGRLFNAKRVSFLGLKSSGKTQLLSSLGAKEASPGVESHGDKYKAFSFRMDGEDRKYFVRGGADYGGGLTVFKTNFVRLIRKGHVAIYVIDIDLFLKNSIVEEDNLTYQASTLARLDFINDNVTNSQKEKVHILLTHADLRPEFSKSALIDMFMSSTKNKPYSVLTKNCYAVDARDKESVRIIFSNILSR